MEEADVVVVGAGLYGLSAAVTYHRLHPSARLLVLDAAPSVGGPWAPQRVFPGLKTNNLWGTYQNPDFAMDEQKFGVKKGEHVPAGKVAEYLTALAHENGISEKLRLNTRVELIEKVEHGWKLQCVLNTSEPAPHHLEIFTAKLILSTGLTNQPFIPEFPLSSTFRPSIVHSSKFAEQYDQISRPGSHTLVIGGGKSAWDIAYACATQPNSTATMLIRPSGKGPVWMSPSHVTPLGLWLEKLVFTRFFGYMSPCPWATTTGLEGWVRSFLHGTWLGRKIVAAFWGVMGDDVVALNKLNEHPETQKLRPWRGAFEVGNALSILNYPTNFFDLVKEGTIKIVIDEVASFEDINQVLLQSGNKLEVDAVVCATGWKTGGTIKFKPDGLENELGIPTTTNSDISDQKLVNKVEEDIYERFPFLKERDTSRLYHPMPELRYTQPSREETNRHPYRLYRFLVPPTDFDRRSIGFAGALMNLGNASCAYLQGLWLTAYLDGTLPAPTSSIEQIKYETYRDTQYCALRNAMGYGNKFPDLVFDSLPYFDLLLKDLGFAGKRKGGIPGTRFARESFKSYGPEDYTGLVEEWERTVRDRGEGKKNV